jgi:hypothetical protein
MVEKVKPKLKIKVLAHGLLVSTLLSTNSSCCNLSKKKLLNDFLITHEVWFFSTTGSSVRYVQTISSDVIQVFPQLVSHL